MDSVEAKFKEFQRLEAELAKKTKNDMLAQGGQSVWKDDPVGLPDDKDKANIDTLIKTYDTANPGVIRGYVEHAKAQRDANFNDFGATRDKNNQLRHTMTIPGDLIILIERAYPLMFANKKHIHWFKKNYPMFSTANRL